jgi:hypothetical protein
VDLPDLVSGLSSDEEAGRAAAWKEERFDEIVAENLEVAAAVPDPSPSPRDHARLVAHQTQPC